MHLSGNLVETCLKSKRLKIKRHTVPVQSVEAPTPAIPSDFIDCLEAAESKNANKVH